MYKLYYSKNLNHPIPRRELLLETLNPATAKQTFEKLCQDIGKTKSSVCIEGSDGKPIAVVWYSEYYDEPIQSRHYVTHQEYNLLFNSKES